LKIDNCGGGKGHWEVQVQIADATYSQVGGFLGACNRALASAYAAWSSNSQLLLSPAGVNESLTVKRVPFTVS
jgi:hypothetical protein